MDFFKIKGESPKKDSYGFDQEWYKTKWQRSGGCGPTVAASLLYYMQNAISGEITAESSIQPDELSLRLTKELSLKWMEEVWKHVTPSIQGVNTTKTFYNGVLAYAKSHGMSLRHEFIDIPRKRTLRPPFDRLLSFIGDALEEDSPVAFLNLHNGGEKALYSWHWVTIIGLEYEEDGSSACATIMDEGSLKVVDLFQWFKKTKLGGGFVYFKRI